MSHYSAASAFCVCPQPLSAQGVPRKPWPVLRRLQDVDAKFRELPNQKYTLQIAVEDCTGCELCVEVCPGRTKSNARARL